MSKGCGGIDGISTSKERSAGERGSLGGSLDIEGMQDQARHAQEA